MKQLIFSLFCSILFWTACNTGTKTETTGSDTSSTSSLNNLEESKEERNKQVALESVHAVIANKPEEAFKNVAVDAVEYGDGSGPTTKGVDSIKAGMKIWMDNVKDYKGDNLEAVADGNKVVVYGDWSGTFKGDFMGHKVAGKSFKTRDADIFTFNDEGKITEHRAVQSMAGMFAALENK
jgi:predicted ester cyclase